MPEQGGDTQKKAPRKGQMASAMGGRLAMRRSHVLLGALPPANLPKSKWNIHVF